MKLAGSISIQDLFEAGKVTGVRILPSQEALTVMFYAGQVHGRVTLDPSEGDRFAELVALHKSTGNRVWWVAGEPAAVADAGPSPSATPWPKGYRKPCFQVMAHEPRGARRGKGGPSPGFFFTADDSEYLEAELRPHQFEAFAVALQEALSQAQPVLLEWQLGRTEAAKTVGAAAGQVQPEPDLLPDTTGDREADAAAFRDWTRERLLDKSSPIVASCAWCHEQLTYVPHDTCVMPVVGGHYLVGTGTCKKDECQSRTWWNIFVLQRGPKLFPGVPVVVLREKPDMIDTYLEPGSHLRRNDR